MTNISHQIIENYINQFNPEMKLPLQTYDQKYIIVISEDKPCAVIFPKYITHADVYYGMRHNYLISAGFLSIRNNRVRCHGHSESIKQACPGLSGYESHYFDEQLIIMSLTPGPWHYQ